MMNSNLDRKRRTKAAGDGFAISLVFTDSILSQESLPSEKRKRRKVAGGAWKRSEWELGRCDAGRSGRAPCWRGMREAIVEKNRKEKVSGGRVFVCGQGGGNCRQDAGQNSVQKMPVEMSVGIALLGMLWQQIQEHVYKGGERAG
jgi:hypothetical protein